MEDLLRRLGRGEILVADGAMGSLLMERGLESGQCPEELNLTSPGLLEEIAGLYLEAGADIVQTNTFGGSPLKLAAFSLDHRAAEVNGEAVAAVRRAVDGRAYLSASCGPSGRILKPYGDTAPEEVGESFEVQMLAFAEAGCDLICIETMIDLQEMLLALSAAKRVAPGIPVMATMTFNSTPRGYFTVMGDTVAEAAGALADAGADVVGSNCGNGTENMIEIAREFREHTSLPLVIQSNAGLPEVHGGDVVYPESPEFMAGKVPELLDAGVSVIGGCCGTTPEHIHRIREAVDACSPGRGR
jgi:5-methyltetrahydrofolate--homocysteine methyltransferase